MRSIKKYILNRNVRLLKSMLISMHSILGWASFCMNYCSNAAWHGGNQPVALLRCNGSPGCFDSGPSGHLHCWVWYISFFLLTIPHRFSMGFSLGEFAGQSSTVTPWSLNQLLVPLALCGQVQSPAGKLNQHLHKACQQKEAWIKCSKISWWMAALTVDFRKHSGPTPANDMAAQIITDCENFTLDFKQHGFCTSPLFFQTLGPWFPN